MDKIFEYLHRRKRLHETMLTVVKQANDQTAIEEHRFAIDMLEDIIHDLKVLVKADLLDQYTKED